MSEDLNTTNEDVVSVTNENDGANASATNIVVDSELQNGQLVPDPTEVSQQASVNSRNQ